MTQVGGDVHPTAVHFVIIYYGQWHSNKDQGQIKLCMFSVHNRCKEKSTLYTMGHFLFKKEKCTIHVYVYLTLWSHSEKCNTAGISDRALMVMPNRNVHVLGK